MSGKKSNMKDEVSSANTFDAFKNLASRPDLSNFEKIGFPNQYRDGIEDLICHDISQKLRLESLEGQKVLDIGAGCSGLPLLLHTLAKTHGHQIYLLDSLEMLSNLPSNVLDGSIQIYARFPDCEAFIEENSGTFDSINCYSVIQYALNELSIFKFLDAMLLLLKPGGRILIGDIPNTSMRKRFLSSAAGLEFHKKYYGETSKPTVSWNSIESNSFDDSVVISLILRARQAGFHSFIVPQDPNMPLSNRREDILIVNP